ncbi:hypothetical protein HD806DRAFT_543984 [Xylariaceae sp. AK1471]|nr:hypothetical protein HD806DRAFT_543984 [Xylariaceae sp. AK1471]
MAEQTPPEWRQGPDGKVYTVPKVQQWRLRQAEPHPVVIGPLGEASHHNDDSELESPEPEVPTQYNHLCSLPEDIREKIFQAVAGIPSWIWFRFELVPPKQRFFFEQLKDMPCLVSEDPAEVTAPRTSSYSGSKVVQSESSLGEHITYEGALPDDIFVVITNETPLSTNEEINTCKIFQASKELRKGLSISGEQPNLNAIALQVVDSMNGRPYARGPKAQRFLKDALRITEEMQSDIMAYFDPPFKIDIQGLICTPKVRTRVDWCFLDGYITAFNRYSRITTKPIFPEIVNVIKFSTIVLRLQDMYDGLCERFGRPRPGEDPEDIMWPSLPPDDILGIDRVPHPDRIIGKPWITQIVKLFGHLAEVTAKVAECKILVGDVPKDVQPSNLEELKVSWNDDKSSVIVDADPPVSEEDKRMMHWVKLELDSFNPANLLEWGFFMMNLDETPLYTRIEEWPAQYFHTLLKQESVRPWLNTTSGHDWLKTHPAWDWLVWTDSGWEFLESEWGVEWLNSAGASEFLNSEQARHWANPEKKWCGTNAGKSWYKENCPHGVPPKSKLEEPVFKNLDPKASVPWPLDILSSPFISWCFIRYCGNSVDKGKGKETA